MKESKTKKIHINLKKNILFEEIGNCLVINFSTKVTLKLIFILSLISIFNKVRSKYSKRNKERDCGGCLASLCSRLIYGILNLKVLMEVGYYSNKKGNR